MNDLTPEERAVVSGIVERQAVKALLRAVAEDLESTAAEHAREGPAHYLATTWLQAADTISAAAEDIEDI